MVSSGHCSDSQIMRDKTFVCQLSRAEFAADFTVLTCFSHMQQMDIVMWLVETSSHWKLLCHVALAVYYWACAETLNVRRHALCHQDRVITKVFLSNEERHQALSSTTQIDACI